MSLIALATRIAVVQALAGTTFAEKRVYDSAIDPIDHKLAEEAQPVIIVTTDEDKFTPTGRDFVNSSRALQLVIEIGAAAAIRVELDGEYQIEIVIPHTDAGLEVMLGLIAHQIMRTLQSSDSVWAALFRRFVYNVDSIDVRRGAGSEKGVKFALRQMIFACSTLSEPAIGVALAAGDAMHDFLAACAAHPDQGVQRTGQLIGVEIARATLPAWRANLASIGADTTSASNICLPSEAGAPITELTLIAPDTVAETTLTAQTITNVIGMEPE